MNDDHQHSGHFDAAMPLPDEVRIRHSTKPTANDSDDDTRNPTADLVRQKVEAAYAGAPPTNEEIAEVNRLGKSSGKSKHQKFIDELISSGKSLPEIQEAWHEYYAALSDKQKHEVWQEFYAEHGQSSHAVTSVEKQSADRVSAPVRQPRPKRRVADRAAGLRHKAPAPRTRQTSSASPLRSLGFGLAIGAAVLLIFLFSFFNERFIAPFIQPSRTATSTPIINDSTTASSKSEIIIPKINVEIPVIYTVKTIDQNAVETALEGGVVHYADTALPGQNGNGVIVGHSSNNIFNPGKYKFAFVLLSRLEKGDTFYLDRDGTRYTYQVYKKTIVKPTDVSVLGPQANSATFTLITCDPPGTSINRLVVVGQQISPSPKTNTAAIKQNSVAIGSSIIPGDSPTLWSRLVNFLEH